MPIGHPNVLLREIPVHFLVLNNGCSVVPECGKKPCYGKKISVFGPELATMLMMFLLWGPRGYKRLC